MRLTQLDHWRSSTLVSYERKQNESDSVLIRNVQLAELPLT